MVTAGAQVKDVSVRGWDVTRKEVVIGTRPAATESARVGTGPTELAAAFGDRTFVATDVPYGDVEQVEAAAAALAEQIASTHARFEGTARGNARLRAGTAVSLGAVGAPFEGKYTLGTTRHVFDGGDYRTEFASTGRHDRSLGALISGGGSDRSVSPAFVTAPVPGVVSAIVTNIRDDRHLGRVKVQIPRLDDDYESDWLRVVHVGAGADRGALVLPEVGDEVLVAFEHGDVRRGYVLGGVYNGRDIPNGDINRSAVAADGTVARRTFTSRKGHAIVLSDEDGDEHIELATKNGASTLKLARDGDRGAVLIGSRRIVTIDAQGDVTIHSGGRVTIDADGPLALRSRAISLESRSSLTLKGQRVTVEGTSLTEIKGVRTNVTADVSLDLTGGSSARLRAAMVRIN
jgi:uncharacterized protein involved in type VI secretion and phage assembly